MNTKTNKKTLYEVDLETACRHIHNYKEEAAAQFPGEPGKILKGFILHTEELLEAADLSEYQPKFKKVRIYIGKTGTTDDDPQKFKLYLTPVNDGGSDHIPKRKKLDKLGNETDEEEGYVYDFNNPCPNSCDPNSPLFNA